MKRRWTKCLAAALLVGACGQRTEGASPTSAKSANSTADTARAEAWKVFVPPGAKVEEHLTVDLDGDGVPEFVLLSSQEDQDLIKTEGVTTEQIRMNLTLTVQVLSSRAGRLVELGRTEMLGGLQPLRVTPLNGGGARRFVVASALHCGASCAGIELHVLGLQGGRVEHLLDRDSVDKGEVTVAADGTLEVRETVYASSGGESDPAGRKVSRYAVRHGELAVASERTEPLPSPRVP